MQNKPLMIYRDGNFSRWETYKPALYAKVLTFGKNINFWFETQTR